MSKRADIHNEVVAEVVKKILSTALMTGCRSTEVMVMLESITAGVMLGVVRLGGDEIVMDALAEGVKLRLAEIRLGGMETEGSA